MSAESSGKSAGAAGPKKPRGRPFQKGQSGNPGGRPKGFRSKLEASTREGEEVLETALKVMRGELSVETKVEGVTITQTPSIKERWEATKFLIPYLAGHPSQTVEHTGAEGGPLIIEVVKLAGEPKPPSEDE